MKTKITLALSTLFTFFWGSNELQAQCNITGLNANYCTNSAATTLTAGMPGGTFSGPGISGSVFTPSAAGAGTHVISYNSGCTQYSLTTAPFFTLTTAGTGVTLGDDQVSGGLPIGFSFTYFCNTYTTFYISSNGFITFANNTNSGCCAGESMPTNNTAYPYDIIAYAWTDLYPPAGGSITYTTIGSAPTRTLLVSFNAINHYNSGSYCCPITAQIRLFETTNVIEIHTTTKPLPTNTYNTTMGIMNAAASNAYPVVGRNASATWTATNECQRWTPAQTCNVSQTTVVSPSTISVIGTNSICTGQTTTLTATGNTTYTWNTGSNSTSVVVTPTTTTTYAVLATNAFGCQANSAITVTVDNSPTVTAVSSSPAGGVCPGATVTLNGAGATSYSWTGGIQNNVPFTIGGQSSYTLTGANACGTASAIVNVSIHPLPSVSAVVAQPTICSGVAANLTGVGNATVYNWTGGVVNGVNFFPSTTNVYTVVGTSALGCTNSAVAGVTVVTTPINPPLPNPPLICIGGSATLTSSGASSYTWTTPSGIQSGSLISVSPNSTTTYTLSKSNSNCVNTQTVQVIVNQLPTLSVFSTPTLVCANNSATLFAGGAQSYTWNAGGTPAYTVSGSSPIVSPSVTTTYTLSASDGTCVNTTTLTVATNPNPTITIAATSTNICRGDQVSLTANGALGYTWTSPAISSNTNATTINESPSTTTLFVVTGTNNFNCTSTTQQVIIVRPTPTLQIANTKTLVCTGAPSSMTVSSSAGAGVSPCTYAWSSNAANATTTVVTVNPLVSTVYTVVGTAPNQCTTALAYPVSVFLPTFAVNSPTQSCQGGTIVLTASGANTYTWNGNQPFASIPVSPAGPTVYVVSATSNSSGVNCISTRSVQVTIYTNPTVTAVATRTQVCKTESTTILGGGAVTYTLNTNDTGTLITVYPVGNATTYTLTGTDQNGCHGTTTISIKTSICFGINEQSKNLEISIYPNPNNGTFTVKGAGSILLALYSETGQLVQNIELTAENAYQVHVEHLAKGIYFLSGSNGTERINEKIIIGQ